MSGVVLISRWMDEGEGAPGAELTGAAALAGAAHGEVLPDEPGPAAARVPSPAVSAKAKLIGLAVLTAAGWGLGPVLIDLAADAYGRVTATMMILSQVCGALMLGAILLWRRPRAGSVPADAGGAPQGHLAHRARRPARVDGERALLPHHRRTGAGAGDAHHGHDAGVLHRLRRRLPARASRPAPRRSPPSSPWPACSSPPSTACADRRARGGRPQVETRVARAAGTPAAPGDRVRAL